MVKQSLVYDVKQLQRVLQGTPDKEVNIDFSFGSTSDPHGPLGGNTLTLSYHNGRETKRLTAHTFEEEMQHYPHREYDDLIKLYPFMKAEGHVWNSYEKWLEYYRCKCGKHGSDGKQPFRGE